MTTALALLPGTVRQARNDRIVDFGAESPNEGPVSNLERRWEVGPCQSMDKHSTRRGEARFYHLAVTCAFREKEVPASKTTWKISILALEKFTLSLNLLLSPSTLFSKQGVVGDVWASEEGFQVSAILEALKKQGMGFVSTRRGGIIGTYICWLALRSLCWSDKSINLSRCESSTIVILESPEDVPPRFL